MSGKPEAVQRIEHAEEKIVSGVELAAKVTEELSKFGDTDFDTVTRLSGQFLDNIKEAQSTLQDVIKGLPLSVAFQGRSYIQRLQTEAAEAAAAATKAPLEVQLAAEATPQSQQPAVPDTDSAEPMDTSATSPAGDGVMQ